MSTVRLRLSNHSMVLQVAKKLFAGKVISASARLREAIKWEPLFRRRTTKHDKVAMIGVLTSLWTERLHHGRTIPPTTGKGRLCGRYHPTESTFPRDMVARCWRSSAQHRIALRFNASSRAQTRGSEKPCSGGRRAELTSENFLAVRASSARDGSGAATYCLD